MGSRQEFPHQFAVLRVEPLYYRHRCVLRPPLYPRPQYSPCQSLGDNLSEDHPVLAGVTAWVVLLGRAEVGTYGGMSRAYLQ